MLLTIPKYSKLKGVPYTTIRGYLDAGLLKSEVVGGFRMIDSLEPVPVARVGGWPKGKPRKKKSDLDVLGSSPPPAG
jgi:hypothetical protein